MIVGLLECDHVAEHLVDRYGDYSDMFQRLFPNISFQCYDVFHGHFPVSVDACDGYMVTGSKHSVYDDIAWIHLLKAFIQDIYIHQKYYIGICFGHQMLAQALDGKVKKNLNGWCVGVHTFKILEQEPWMIPFQKKMNLLMSCQDQVDQLPKQSVILASSKDCPFGMFRVGNRMLGVQGHPEFQKEYNRELINARVDRIGTAKVKESMKSLELHNDRDIFVDWVMRFLADNHLKT